VAVAGTHGTQSSRAGSSLGFGLAHESAGQIGEKKLRSTTKQGLGDSQVRIGNEPRADAAQFTRLFNKWLGYR